MKQFDNAFECLAELLRARCCHCGVRGRSQGSPCALYSDQCDGVTLAVIALLIDCVEQFCTLDQ